MGVLGDLGASELENSLDLTGAGSTILLILLVIVVLVITGVGAYLYYSKKYKKNVYKNQVPIFMKVTGKFYRIGVDWAKELFIPETNISLFFLRDRKIYLARPTRSMGKDEFWYHISENGEWINFDISNKPEDNTLSVANYDHRDTRYAYVNLKDIIKRNYTDKAVVWWKEYSGVITIVIISIMFIAAMWFFFWRTGQMMDQMGPLTNTMKSTAENLLEAAKTMQNINSGVIQT